MNTINPQTLIEATISALERTAMMLVEPIGSKDVPPKPTKFARIHYRGPSKGTLMLGATDGFVRELAASLLGVELSEVSVDIEGTDALKELSNILGGSIVLAMSGETCDYSLGLPEIMTGAEMPALPRSESSSECTVIADGGGLRVVWMQDQAVKAA